METQEPYYVSNQELEDADEMLSHHADIEIHPPTRVIHGIKGKLIEREAQPWVKLSVRFRDTWIGKLKGSKLAVFLVIALHIDQNGKSFPTIEKIADETEYSTREVKRAVQELKQMGFIDVDCIWKDKIHKKNYYTIKAMISMGDNNPEVDFLSTSKVTLPARQKSLKEEPVSRTINMQENTFFPIGRNGDNMRTKEELMKGTEEAYLRSLNNSTSDYAHIPEYARPWIQKVCELWNLKPPGRKAKDLGYWITGASDLQDACSEFGIDLLTDIHAEWKDGFQNGCAPWTINAPNSLVKTARGKAGMKRQGISGTIKQGKPKYHSLLDV
jgi:biotin operon repressor